MKIVLAAGWGGMKDMNLYDGWLKSHTHNGWTVGFAVTVMGAHCCTFVCMDTSSGLAHG